MCQNFPYSPLECKNCNKLFCKFCQFQLHNQSVESDEIANLSQRMGNLNTNSNERKHKQHKKRQILEVCCPNCQERGDFLKEVNKVLRNCLDFCEFPHRCFKDSKHGEIIWKTMRELQEHAMFDCPKFGCDICYHEDFQHMTSAQIFQHIKRECPEVSVQCQVCNKDFNRSEFAKHECLKDVYVQRLKQMQFDVFDYLAENLMMLRRSKESLGLCMK